MQDTTGYRVYGPYRARRGWRIVVIAGDGSRSSERYPKEADAVARVRQIRAIAENETSITEALDQFEDYLEDTGVKPVTVYTNMRRLRTLVAPHADCMRKLTPSKGQRLYDRMRGLRKDDGSRMYSVDYHRNSLSAAKRFGAWVVKKRMVKRNPFEKVEGVGRRNRGKEQLTSDEARKLLSSALSRSFDEPGALATVLALLLGLRAGELANLRVRDLDEGGAVLRVAGTKTDAAKRRVRVPELLRGPLHLRSREGLTPNASLLGLTRYGVHYHVKRLCRLAEVPEVTPHGLRGTHATLATEAGATGDLVMRQLGHTSTEVARRHYTAEGAAEAAQGRLALEVLQGGLVDSHQHVGGEKSLPIFSPPRSESENAPEDQSEALPNSSAIAVTTND